MASSVDRRIEGYLSEDMGHCDPREPDQASIRGTHQGLRPLAALTGQTHDRKRPAVAATRNNPCELGAIHTCPRAARSADPGDAAKKVKGRKRRVVTDNSGLLVGAAVHPADIQDRDGAGLVIGVIHDLFPWLRHLFADSVYNGPDLHKTLVKFGDWTIEIVKRTATGFELLPRRWAVERTLAWLNRNRRLAKDFEATLARATTWVYIASVNLLVRRLACQ
jgi:transposase